MRQPASSGKLGISLFPFLDALICMMGGLIVILAVVSRGAALQAKSARAAQVAERLAQVPVAAKVTKPTPPATPVESPAVKELAAVTELREEVAWRLEHLRTTRAKTVADLQNERLRLSSAEDQVRQLKQQLEELTAAMAQIQGNSDQNTQSRTRLTQTLDSVRQQLEAARQRLAVIQQEAAQRKPSYAVVPYEGPNRTKRRPLYIECTADKIIIQPEGIIILPSDLAGPPGPGNPLASTIRAMRDGMLASAPDPTSPDAEPYPLFLVRPSGIVAYYEAREAMASWANEIGYQVVEQDWPLSFPAADPVIAAKANAALADARQRFAWLAQTNPELAKRGAVQPRATYRVAPTGGGLIAESNPAGSSSVPSWSSGAGSSSGGAFDSSARAVNAGNYGSSTGTAGGNNLAGLSANTRLGGSGTGSGGSSSSGVSSGSGGSGKGSMGSSQYAPGAAPTNIYGNLNPVMDSTAANNGSNPGSAPGYGMTGGTNPGSNSGAGTSSGAPGSPGGSAMHSASFGNSSGSAGNSGQAAGSGQTAAGSGSFGSGSAGSANGGTGSSASGTAGQTGSGSAGMASSSAAGQQGAAATMRQYGDLNQKTPSSGDGTPSDTPAPINTPLGPRTPPKSLAATKGKDWANMRNGRGTSPVSRPVRLQISGAQIVLPADPTINEPARTVPLYAETGQAIPSLVQQIEQRIDKWGLAGKGLYWSPELVIDVQPDGEGRYADLQTLLDNSGWIVRRR